MSATCTLAAASVLTGISEGTLFYWRMAGALGNEPRTGEPGKFLSAKAIVKALFIRELRRAGLSLKQASRVVGMVLVMSPELPVVRSLGPDKLLIVGSSTDEPGTRFETAGQEVYRFDLEAERRRVDELVADSGWVGGPL